MDYSIGKYKFDSNEEYQKALKEAALIKTIKSKYDLTDIEMVKKFLILIKQGKLSFTTSIGKDFISELKYSLIRPNSKASIPINNPGDNKALEDLEESKESKASIIRNKEPEKGVFYYCYLPIILVAFIIIFCFISSLGLVNLQYRNLVFVAEFIVLYIISEIVMSVVGLGYMKYKEEVKKNHIMARVHIPGKLFGAIVLIMIVLIIVFLIKPYLKSSPSTQEKISFRNEALLDEKIN